MQIPMKLKNIKLQCEKMYFKSNFYLFTLSGHENAKDMLFHQNISQTINAFSYYSIGLDVLEYMGLSRNFTRDLNDNSKYGHFECSILRGRGGVPDRIP